MKKTLILLCIAALLLAICACAAVQPGTVSDIPVDEEMDKAVSDAIIHQEQQHYDGFEVFEEAHQILGTQKGDLEGNAKNTCLTVYVATLFGGYNKTDSGYEQSCGGYQAAAVVLAKKTDDTYTDVLEYWVPRDGAYNTADLKATFPAPVFKLWQSMEQTAESHNQTVAELEDAIEKKLAAK